MGALIPIGGGADAEIKDKLNKRFSGQNLTNLKNARNTGGEDLFDGSHHLQRVAWRLRCYPTKTYNHNAKGKWFYFLHETLPAADDGTGVTTADAIKAVLDQATDPNGTITAVVFDAQEDPNAPCHYVHPSNDDPGILVGNTYNLILVCPAPLSNDTEPDPDQASDADPGEEPLPAAAARRKSGKKANKPGVAKRKPFAAKRKGVKVARARRAKKRRTTKKR